MLDQSGAAVYWEEGRTPRARFYSEKMSARDATHCIEAA
jgi:hypothetical protein